MSHALLKGKMFDVCIIDEAGQVGRWAGWMGGVAVDVSG